MRGNNSDPTHEDSADLLCVFLSAVFLPSFFMISQQQFLPNGKLDYIILKSECSRCIEPSKPQLPKIQNSAPCNTILSIQMQSQQKKEKKKKSYITKRASLLNKLNTHI